MKPIAITTGLSVFLATSMAFSATWPQWRGPSGQGDAGDAKLPIKWSEKDNVTWKTPLPGRGWSSPVIEDGVIWMTAAHETPAPPEVVKERLTKNTGSQPVVVLEEARFHAVGVDLKTGRLLHDIKLFSEKNPQWVHRFNSYASPSPIVKDGRLYCHFGSSGTACLDTKTPKVLWTNTDDDLRVMHENGPGGSPVLWEDVLVIHQDGSDHQLIAALDTKTGKQKWKTPRSGELNPHHQLKKAYATPLVLEIGGKAQIVSQGANWLYGYEPATGKELWKLAYGRLGFSNVARPVYADGRLYLCTGFMKSELQAIDLASSKPSILWQYNKQVPSSPSPIAVGGEVYFVGDSGGTATCLDAETGDMIWRERLASGKYWSSPTYANGHIYFHNEEGVTTVIKAGREFEIVSENKLDGKHFASAAVAGNALILRTDKALYRIEE